MNLRFTTLHRYAQCEFFSTLLKEHSFRILNNCNFNIEGVAQDRLL
ncbi:MAG TPA: hypothetical protein VHO70_18285 [Chitinispirillaceae bacterium]|nr:hypothetical protein [Chitinispirillaceae bacterium]